MARLRQLRGAALLAVGFACGAIAVGGAFAAKYVTGGDTEVTSIKLTGGGLPDLGQTSTYGVAELPGAIRSYHDSGAYDSDLVTVDAQARKALSKQLKTLAGSPGPGKYSECNDKGRKCHKVEARDRARHRRDVALQLRGAQRGQLPAAGTVTGAVAGNDPVIAPTLALYEYARSKGVEAFFITGRPEAIEADGAVEPRQCRLRQGLQPDHEAARRGHDDRVQERRAGRNRGGPRLHDPRQRRRPGLGPRRGARAPCVQAPQPDVLHSLSKGSGLTWAYPWLPA